MKPQNVLMFEDGPGSYTAKVADFGFSTHFRGARDPIQMPTSVPWNAPEHHDRAFYPQTAKAVDVYSFGMLCLWVLFDNRSLRTQDFSFEAEYWQNKHDLSLFWKINKLLDWAMQLVADDARIGIEMKSSLSSFFQSCLGPDTEKRNADWVHLINCIAPIQ